MYLKTGCTGMEESAIYIYIYYDKKPLQGRATYPPLLSKSRIHTKRPIHTEWVILWLCWRADPNELFPPKGIPILDLMEMPPRPRPLPLKPTPWG
jgi:hypothetical protein